MNSRRPAHLFVLIALAVITGGSVADGRVATDRQNGPRTVRVAGSGVDHLHTALVHSEQPTPTGVIKQSTETVELTGDLTGRVLYHVTTTIDTGKGTLVNTGHQVYSGTIAGSAPVMLHDDRFRFEVNLLTGQEKGQVYLLNHIAGPRVRCTLDVVGTGLNAGGNPTFDYTGACTFRGR